MKIATLLASEFPLLKEVADGIVPDPKNTLALVALDGQKIVGRMFLMAPAHIEGTWIDSAHRNGLIAARLLKRMEQESAKAGITNLFAYSQDDAVSDYLKRMGYEQTKAIVFRKELSCR